ncbi:hypothetical protein KJ865_03405, partial [Myxococcota bacterium]|nr:hypothetical protein [Myxococcota bacterium]
MIALWAMALLFSCGGCAGEKSGKKGAAGEPRDPVEQAARLLGQGQYQEAMDLLVRAKEKNATNAAFWNLYGMTVRFVSARVAQGGVPWVEILNKSHLRDATLLPALLEVLEQLGPTPDDPVFL